MMWMHSLLRLDGRCPSLCSPWLTWCMSMWPWSVGASLSSVVACGLGIAEAVWSMSWFIQSLVNWMYVNVASNFGASPSSVVARKLIPAGAIAWLCRNGCWIKLILAAVLSSHRICQEGVVRRPKVISEDFLKLVLRRVVWMREQQILVGWLCWICSSD